MMGSDPLSLVLTAYLAMAVVMVGLWVLQLRVRNASIADVGWCAGLIAVVLWYATQATGDTERKCWWLPWPCSMQGGWDSTSSSIG